MLNCPSRDHGKGARWTHSYNPTFSFTFLQHYQPELNHLSNVAQRQTDRLPQGQRERTEISSSWDPLQNLPGPEFLISSRGRDTVIPNFWLFGQIKCWRWPLVPRGAIFFAHLAATEPDFLEWMRVEEFFSFEEFNDEKGFWLLIWIPLFERASRVQTVSKTGF